jgi:hypothetical protein
MNHAALVRFSVVGPDGYHMALNSCSPGKSHIRTCPEKYQKSRYLQDKALTQSLLDEIITLLLLIKKDFLKL